MVNKAKSQELKNQINRKEVDDLKAYASKLYADELSSETMQNMSVESQDG